jgi:cholesterol oxidase
MATPNSQTYDFVIIGSGFGGSVSALRLTEKGYQVLVLERGKRFGDNDYPKSYWNIWKYLWAPALRRFGIMQFSLLREVLVLHGSGVGGGSLVYANVLMEPDEKMFTAPDWSHLADWKTILRPHYDTARRMLGVIQNPRLWPADGVLKQIAVDLGTQNTFSPTQVGVYFGDNGNQGIEVPDPYFGGLGPARRSCTHCGGCMVGCRYNAKNSLNKNYLYFAEKWGAEIRAEALVQDIRPLPAGQPDEARYEVIYTKTTAWLRKPKSSVRARNVILSAGSLGTQRLLFRCRDITRSLPQISPMLGEKVRTNSESLLGVTNRGSGTNYSEGIAITSVVHADAVTAVEPVRYPDGSSLIRLLAAPLIKPTKSIPRHIAKTLGHILLHPIDALKTSILPGWAYRSTILLVMQTEDNHIHLRLGRSLFTFFGRNLISLPGEDRSIPSSIDLGHRITRDFARRTDGIPLGTINEALLNIPTTAHILGGCPMGVDDQEGVVDVGCQVHHYPGLYVVDGSIVPANPGINPSLTITALAEYAMSCISPKPGASARQPLGIAASPHDQQALPLVLEGVQ